MLYGQARFSNGTKLVTFTGVSQTQGGCVFCRIVRGKWGRPSGNVIKRHISKHGVKIHGEDIIRHDWINKANLK